MSTPQLPPRYTPLRPLGEGGMGDVLLAHDAERGHEVALKVLRPVEGGDAAEARYLFKQEFWAMVALAHPNLVQPFDFGELADGTPYFTMEHVDGSDLAARGQQDEDAVRGWLPGLALALAHLHARGYVHADLTPGNVRVLADGTVKLMDLGLLTRAGRAGGAIRGTPAYLAPEVIRQGALDARTDLYELGLVLYEALAGKPPFPEGPTVAILRAHLSQGAPPLTTAAPGVSAGMARAVKRLLGKDPADRFAGAGDLLAALGLEGAGAVGAALLGSPIVGREEAQAALAGLVNGQGTEVVLAGGAGTGKTRLLAEVRAEAQLVGLPAFAAKGAGAGAAPYEALVPWLRALTAAPSPARDRLAPVLARVAPWLVGAPGLEGLEPAVPLAGNAERLRLHAAVAELAGEIAPEALWLLDDADRLDPASAELLKHLRGTGRAGWRWAETREAAVAAAGASGPLAPAGGAGVLELAPLGDSHLYLLARALLGQRQLPAAVMERLPDLAGGSPGAAEAVLGHWVRTGALVRVDGAWVEAKGAAFDLPGGLAVALGARFEALSGHARLVGRLAGLVGGDLPAAGLLALAEDTLAGEAPAGAAAKAAAGVERAEAAFFAAVDELEDAEVLRREGASLVFVRPAQAPVLASSWPAPEARKLHDAAAAWLERALGREPDDPAAPMAALMAIARQRLPGDRPAQAAPWAIAAARRALALGAAATAETIVLPARGAKDLKGADKLALGRLEALVARLMGRAADSVRIFEEEVVPALRAAGDPALATELTSVGVAHQMLGRYDAAGAAYAEAIATAEARGDAADLAKARLNWGRLAYFAGNPAEAKARLAEAVACAREAGATNLLAGALALYGYMVATSEPEREAEGLEMLEEAVSLSQGVGDVVEAHEAQNLRGLAAMAAGRLEDAEAAFAGCRELAERAGMGSELPFARLNLGAVAIERHRPAVAREHAAAALLLARRQGRKFPEAFALAVDGLATVLADDASGLATLDAGLAIARELGNRYLELQIAAYRAEALTHLGELDAAEAALADARALATASANNGHDARFARLAGALAWLRGRRALRSELAASKGRNPVPATGPDDEADGGRYRQLCDRLAAVGAAADLGSVLARALDALMDIADAERGHLLLYEGASLAEQVFAGDAGPDDFSVGLAFKVFWSEEPIWIEDASADEELQASRSVRAIGLRSVLGVPLIAEDAYGGEPETIGVMLAESRRVMEGFAAADMALVRELGRQVAGMIKRTKRTTALTAENETLAVLAELGTALLATPDPEEAFKLTAAAAIAATGTDRALLLAGEALEPRYGVDAEGAVLPPEARSASRTVAGWVFQRGEAVRIVDAQSDEALARARSVMALGLRTITAAPVIHGTRRLGVLYLDDQRLGEPDPAALARVARIAAMLGAWIARQTA